MKTKKELKEEYKQSKPKMGVFSIRNLENGKILIDYALDVEAKWNRHKMELKFGSHKNKELQSDWKNLGEEQFRFEILSTLEHKEDEFVDYQKELELLKSIVSDELNLSEENRY